MKNEVIGMLGETYIQQQMNFGAEFDQAWDDWQELQKKLAFICRHPEVQFYDDRRVSDCNERQRLRELAKLELGNHVRSPDVSMLANVAGWMRIEVPIRPYRMDRAVVEQWLHERAERLEMEYDICEAATARHLAESEAVIEDLARRVEAFAETHSLWAVSSERLIRLYYNHWLRLLTTTVTCDGCKEDVTLAVDHSAEDLQKFRVGCRKCGRWTEGQLLIDEGGEAVVLWTRHSEDSGEREQ